MSLESKLLLQQGSRLLDRLGIFDVHGHLSARRRSDPERALITGRTGPRAAGLHDFVGIDVGASDHPPAAPGETPIHTAIYRRRGDVRAVCHHHAPYTVAVASLGLDLRPVHAHGAVQPDAVDVYDDYDPEGATLITTDDEARTLAGTLGGDYAVALDGHGAVVVGESVPHAVVNSIKLEYNSRLLYRQAAAGEPSYLAPELAEAEAEHGHSPGSVEKSLDYYLRVADDG